MGVLTAVQQMIFTRLMSTPSWRNALRCLAVFPPPPGSFSEAAAAVVGQVDASAVQALAQAGFLTRTAPARFSLPRLVCETVAADGPDEGACGRMIDIYSGYAKAHGQEFSVLTAEFDNLARCLELAETRQPVTFARMLLHLGAFLELRGDYPSWKEWLLKAREVTGITSSERALLLLHLANVQEKSGENQAALEAAEAGLDEAKDDPELRGPLLAILGHIEMNEGMLQPAREHLFAGLELARQLDKPNALFSLLVSVGIVLTRLGDYAEATRYTQEGIALARERNNTAVLCSLLTNLGVLLYQEGRFEEAVRVDEEGLAVARQIGYSEQEAALLQALGGALIRTGQPDRAESSLKEGLAIAARIAHPWYVATIRNNYGYLLLEQNRFEEAIELFKQAAGESLTASPDVQGYALFGLARAYAHTGRQPESREALERSLAIFDSMHHYAAGEIRRWMEKNSALSEPSSPSSGTPQT